MTARLERESGSEGGNWPPASRLGLWPKEQDQSSALCVCVSDWYWVGSCMLVPCPWKRR